METVRVKIDLVTSDSDGRSWRLVLVEGPWDPADSPMQLALLAKRISDAIAAALTGQMAARYPDSAGHAMTIQVDSYDTPRQQVDALIAQARAKVEASADIQTQLKRREFISALEFEHHWFDWQEEFDKREGPRRGGILQRLRSWFGRAHFLRSTDYADYTDCGSPRRAGRRPALRLDGRGRDQVSDLNLRLT